MIELTIGYHQLSGKIVPLKKPFAVLERMREDSEAGAFHSGYKVCGVPSGHTQGGYCQKDFHYLTRQKALQTTLQYAQSMNCKDRPTCKSMRLSDCMYVKSLAIFHLYMNQYVTPTEPSCAFGGNSAYQLAVQFCPACICRLAQLCVDQLSCLWQVIGIVRQKCLFKTRPKALITKPAAKGGR